MAQPSPLGRYIAYNILYLSYFLDDIAFSNIQLGFIEFFKSMPAVSHMIIHCISHVWFIVKYQLLPLFFRNQRQQFKYLTAMLVNYIPQ